MVWSDLIGLTWQNVQTTQRPTSNHQIWLTCCSAVIGCSWALHTSTETEKKNNLASNLSCETTRAVVTLAYLTPWVPHKDKQLIEKRPLRSCSPPALRNPQTHTCLHSIDIVIRMGDNYSLGRERSIFFCRALCEGSLLQLFRRDRPSLQHDS